MSGNHTIIIVAVLLVALFVSTAFAFAGPPLPGPPDVGDGDEDEDEHVPSLGITLEVSCLENIVNVTVNDGDGMPVAGAEVDVFDEDIFFFLLEDVLTDENGQVKFEGCGRTVKVAAKKSGYLPATIIKDLVSCGECPCESDDDCLDDEVCHAIEFANHVPVLIGDDDIVRGFTHNSLNTSDPDIFSLKFELKTSDKEISESKGPMATYVGGLGGQTSCIVYAPYILVTAGDDGAVFEVARDDAPGVLSDDEFIIATNLYGPAAECDNDDDGVSAGDYMVPPGSIFMKVSPASDDYGLAEYVSPGFEVDYFGGQEDAEILIQRSFDPHDSDGMTGSFTRLADLGHPFIDYIIGVKDSGGLSYFSTRDMGSDFIEDATLDSGYAEQTGEISCHPISSYLCCGTISNHECNEFDCGADPNCPKCPLGRICENNTCVLELVELPSEVLEEPELVPIQQPPPPEPEPEEEPGFIEGILGFFDELFKGLFGG